MAVSPRSPCLTHRPIVALDGMCNIREMTYQRTVERGYVDRPMCGDQAWFMLSQASGAPRSDSQISEGHP